MKGLINRWFVPAMAIVAILCGIVMASVVPATANDYVPEEMGDFILEMKERIEANTENRCTQVLVTIEFEMVDGDRDYTIGYDYFLYPRPLTPSGRVN